MREPEAWRHNRMWFRLLSFFCLALLGGAAYTVTVFTSTKRGDYVTAAAFGAFVVGALLSAVALARASYGHVSLRSHTDDIGTTFKPDRCFGLLTIVGVTMLIVAGGVFVIGAMFGWVDTPHTRYWKASPYAMAFAVAVSSWRLSVAWRRGGIGYLQVAPDGIENADAIRTDFYHWDDITEVNDRAEKTRTRKAVVLSLVDGEEKILDGLDLYVPRGSALYWMIRHYWQHPGDRAELTDERALERMREGRFETSGT